MKFYILRSDLGENNIPGYELVHSEEDPVGGYYEWVTFYVYRHIATNKLCGFRLMWSEESGSETEGVTMGRWFEEGGEEFCELVPVERKEVVTYQWKEVE